MGSFAIHYGSFAMHIGKVVAGGGGQGHCRYANVDRALLPSA